MTQRTAKPESVDEYLAALPDDARETLRQMREMVRAMVPDAVEGLSYGMPAFRLKGKPVAGFSAAKGHCSFHPMSGAIVEAHQSELAGYETSKGTVRFPIGKPLPASIVEKLVKARIAEIEAGKRG